MGCLPSIEPKPKLQIQGIFMTFRVDVFMTGNCSRIFTKTMINESYRGENLKFRVHSRYFLLVDMTHLGDQSKACSQEPVENKRSSFQEIKIHFKRFSNKKNCNLPDKENKNERFFYLEWVV